MKGNEYPLLAHSSEAVLVVDCLACQKFHWRIFSSTLNLYAPVTRTYIYHSVEVDDLELLASDRRLL